MYRTNFIAPKKNPLYSDTDDLEYALQPNVSTLGGYMRGGVVDLCLLKDCSVEQTSAPFQSMPLLETLESLKKGSNKEDAYPVQLFEQNYPSFNDDVVGYFDFAFANKPGYNYTGKNHLSVVGCGVSVSADADRLNKANFKLPYSAAYAGANQQATSQPSCLRSDTISSAMSTADFSVSVWVKADKSVGLNGIWASSNTGVGGNAYNSYCGVQSHMYVQTIGGVPYIVGQVWSGSAVYNARIPFELNKWVHVCVTTNGVVGGVTWYKNGVAVTPTVTVNGAWNHSTINTRNVFTVGCSPTTTLATANVNGSNYIQHFYGSIADLLLVNRVLSASDVLSIYNDNYGSDIFVIAGQSNAVGYGEQQPEDTDYTSLEGRVFAYKIDTNVNGSFVAVDNTVVPAQNNLPFPLGPSFPSTGLWRTFCIDYLAYTNIPRKRRVLLVPAAYGGAIVSDWSSDDSFVTAGPHYKRMVAAVNAAIGLNGLNKTQGFLWNQGESEAQNAATAPLHKTRLLAMFKRLAESNDCPSLKKKNMPRVLAEISGPHYDQFLTTYEGVLQPARALVNKNMRELTFLDDTFSTPLTMQYVFTAGLSFADQGVHYDAPSLRLMGQRYYKAFIAAVEAGADNLTVKNIKEDYEPLRKKLRTVADAIYVTETTVATDTLFTDKLPLPRVLVVNLAANRTISLPDPYTLDSKGYRTMIKVMGTGTLTVSSRFMKNDLGVLSATLTIAAGAKREFVILDGFYHEI